jgi:hypothetical protein
MDGGKSYWRWLLEERANPRLVLFPIGFCHCPRWKAHAVKRHEAKAFRTYPLLDRIAARNPQKAPELMLLWEGGKSRISSSCRRKGDRLKGHALAVCFAAFLLEHQDCLQCFIEGIHQHRLVPGELAKRVAWGRIIDQSLAEVDRRFPVRQLLLRRAVAILLVVVYAVELPVLQPEVTGIHDGRPKEGHAAETPQDSSEALDKFNL